MYHGQGTEMYTSCVKQSSQTSKQCAYATSSFLHLYEYVAWFGCIGGRHLSKFLSFSMREGCQAVSHECSEHAHTVDWKTLKKKDHVIKNQTKTEPSKHQCLGALCVVCPGVFHVWTRNKGGRCKELITKLSMTKDVSFKPGSVIKETGTSVTRVIKLSPSTSVWKTGSWTGGSISQAGQFVAAQNVFVCSPA